MKKIEENQRATAQGLHSSFETKEIVATACLFREIYAVTGTFSRYLQSVDVDCGKAIDMVDSSIEKIEKNAIFREKTHDILCNNWMHSDEQMSYLALQRHSVSSIALK